MIVSCPPVHKDLPPIGEHLLSFGREACILGGGRSAPHTPGQTSFPRGIALELGMSFSLFGPGLFTYLLGESEEISFFSSLQSKMKVYLVSRPS